MSYKSFINKIGLNSDKKPNLVKFILILLIPTFILTFLSVLFFVWFKYINIDSPADKWLIALLIQPYNTILLASLVYPLLETLFCQMIPIEIVRVLKSPVWLTIVFSSILFSLGHYLWGYNKMIAVFPMGLLLAYAYLRFRFFSIYQAFGITYLVHGLNNLIYFLIMLPLVNINSPLLLHSAARENNMDYVTYINKKVNINVKDKDGWTALILVSYDGNATTARDLLEKDADPNVSNVEGMTPLMWAAYQGHYDVVKILLEHGANGNLKDKNGYTALMWAEQQLHPEIVKALLEKDLDIDAKNKDGETVLIIAVRNNHIGDVQMLLEINADVNIRDKKSNSALKYAEANKSEEIIKILQNAGAKE